MKRWLAITVSAGVFALCHVAVRESVPALFVLGLVLGYAYEKSGSLWRPIMIHLVFNGLSLLTAWWQL